MPSPRKRKLIIDTKDETPFTRSLCSCEVCEDMNNQNDNWEKTSAKPQTKLQKRMKKVISKIETRPADGIKL
jgi:hypothetical protein